MQRGSFFVKEHVLTKMSFLSYAHVSRCARHALEPTNHRLVYADDIMICAVSPHSVVAIRGPLIFSLGATTTVNSTRRTCCSALLAGRCCDDIKHAMRHRADCFNMYSKNISFSIKWYMYNCLYSIPTLTDEHLYLRITNKRHVCEYMFLHKKLYSLHGLSSLSFCWWGPVTPCIYIYIYIYVLWTVPWRLLKGWHLFPFHPVHLSGITVVNWTKYFAFARCCINTENYAEYSTTILRIQLNIHPFTTPVFILRNIVKFLPPDDTSINLRSQ